MQIAAQVAGEFSDGVWYVDLAPITDLDLVPLAAARALGLPDQPGRSTMDTLIRFLGDRHTLVVLDNCEHLLDATAMLMVELLSSCPKLTLLATSREPIAVDGEVIWRVPSLSLADEAIQLFTDRARRARPDFRLTDGNANIVEKVCQRLDGMPLAIELAAAQVRALSLNEILLGLNDRFRLLTGGSRRAVRRSRPCMPQLTGRTHCSRILNACCSDGSPPSWAASTSRPRSSWPAEVRSRPIRSSISSHCWSTSHRQRRSDRTHRRACSRPTPRAARSAAAPSLPPWQA